MYLMPIAGLNFLELVEAKREVESNLTAGIDRYLFHEMKILIWAYILQRNFIIILYKQNYVIITVISSKD